MVSDLSRKKVGYISLFLIALAGLLVQHNPSAENIEGEEQPSVDCPQKIQDTCQDLSQQHNQNVSYLYSSNYTNRDGQAYFVKINDTENIAKIDGKTKRVMPFETS